MVSDDDDDKHEQHLSSTDVSEFQYISLFFSLFLSLEFQFLSDSPQMGVTQRSAIPRRAHKGRVTLRDAHLPAHQCDTHELYVEPCIFFTLTHYGINFNHTASARAHLPRHCVSARRAGICVDIFAMKCERVNCVLSGACVRACACVPLAAVQLSDAHLAFAFFVPVSSCVLLVVVPYRAARLAGDEGPPFWLA